MARTAVSEWYGIKSREQLLERIEDYIEGKMSTPAYDAYRATFLARAGLPAGYLGVDESWQLSLRAAQRVQQTYDGWLAYGMGFLQGHLDYRKGCGDDAAKLADNRKDMLQHLNGLSQGIWSTTQFRTPLLPS
jgi:hypothetical protein